MTGPPRALPVLIFSLLLFTSCLCEFYQGLPPDVVDDIVKSLVTHSALNPTTLRTLKNCELTSLQLAGVRVDCRCSWLNCFPPDLNSLDRERREEFPIHGLNPFPKPINSRLWNAFISHAMPPATCGTI